jgi:hypothetical protein
MNVVEQYFTYNERLGINLPSLQIDWEDYPFIEQQKILTLNKNNLTMKATLKKAVS